jgi:hypothetical protein
VPTFALVGVPASRPVLPLNVAQLGRFVIENVSVLPSGSLAVGWNAYAVPAVTVVAGAPDITGGELGGGFTTIENVGSDAVALPSLTLITMLPYVPT